MSLEYPHKIAEKDGRLHKNAKKDGCLSYLVIFCQDAVVRVSLPTCWVSYNFFFSALTKYTLLLFLQSHNITPSCSITLQNDFIAFFAVTKYNAFLFNKLTKSRFCSLKTH
jgi:hypothetical protein